MLGVANGLGIFDAWGRHCECTRPWQGGYRVVPSTSFHMDERRLLFGKFSVAFYFPIGRLLGPTSFQLMFYFIYVQMSTIYIGTAVYYTPCGQRGGCR